MGSQYSVGPFPNNVRSFANLDLIQVQAKIYRFERTLDRYHKDNVFMSRQQLQWAFELDDISTYHLFQVFDPDMVGFVPAADVWGALALASNATATEKLNFLFYLADLNHDEYISEVDLILQMRCATRGFSNFKRIMQVPMKTINRMAREAFTREGVILSESGEIHVRDLRPYLLVDDKARTYFANLGTLIVVQDSSKLIEQRAELLKELAEVEAELGQVEIAVHSKREDTEVFQSERGGDAHLVRLTEKLLGNFTKKGPIVSAGEENSSKTAKVVLTKEEQQRERRQQRARQGAEDDDDDDEPLTVDNGVFSRGCKPATMTGGGGSEQAIQDAILFKWGTLDQAKDGLVKLDLDTLLDVLEAAGIAIPDEHALLCLNNLPTSLLGRHSVHDLLTWLRRYQVNPPPKEVPGWRSELFSYREKILETLEWGQSWFRRILKQDSCCKEVERFRQKLEDMRPKEKQPLRSKSSVLRQVSSSIGGGTATKNVNILGQSTFEKVVKGSIRLSAWQRHRHTENPSKVSFLGSFGPPIAKRLKSIDKSRRNTSHDDPEKKAPEEKINWKTRISVECFTRPEGKKRDPLVGSDGILRDFDTLNAGDLMCHFDKVGYVVELSASEMATAAANEAARAAGLTISSSSNPPDRSHVSGSICWFAFQVAQEATSEQAYCLLKTATNFFESIPLDYRHELYTSTKGQMFYIEPVAVPVDMEEIMKPSSPNKTKREVIYPRIIVVALLHQRDPLKWTEDQIEAVNILFTRMMRNLRCHLRLFKSFDDLYEESSEFDMFHQKLFGPQEDELGEEGMNPLRFAKMCRKRQKAAQDAIESAPKMTTEQLREHLSMRGLSDKGNRAELIVRVQDAFKRQAELVGYGEMSGFGAEMVRRIFQIFDEDGDGGLSLLEMNKFLIATGAEALYDMKAYKALTAAENLHVDSQYCLTVEGLIAYYEKYGRLAQDIARLGIGSISRDLQGELEVRLEYEADAVHSLFSILEKNTLAQMTLKRILGTISSTSEFLLTGTFSRLSEMSALLRWNKIPQLKSFCDGIEMPGWLAHTINSTCAWLADGSDGLVPSLRQNCKNKFGKYPNYESVFEKLHTPEEKPEVEHDSDDEATAKTAQTSQVDSAATAATDESVDVEAGTVDKEVGDSSTRKKVIDMFQIFYKNAVVKAIDDDSSPEHEKCQPLEPRHPEIEKWDTELNDVLPRLIAYTASKTLMVDEINQRLAGAAAIYRRLSGSERLTRTERENLQTKKINCEKRAASLSAQLEDSVHLCGAHFLAFYDAFRLYGDGIHQIGFGTNESGIKISMTGVDFVPFLPPGLGELSVARQKAKDKYERAMNRKNAAMNAIERERLRRELDEEEKERRRQWEAANVQLVRDEEEKTLFGEAYSALVGAREEKQSQKDIDEIVAMWKHILDLRDARYPEMLKLAVCQNDVACVMLEISRSVPMRVAEATALLRQSSRIAFQHLEDAIGAEIHITENKKQADEFLLQVAGLNEEEILHTTAEKAVEARKVVREKVLPQSPAAFILLFVNYMTSLRMTNNLDDLGDDDSQQYKEAIYLLLDLLTEKERTNIHVERVMELFTVLPLGDVKESLTKSLSELDEHRSVYHKKVEAEKLQKRLEEFKGVKNTRKGNVMMSEDEQKMSLDVLALVDPKKAAKIKFKRQQKEARKKRNISIKQRNKMYRMIASDQISTFFEKQAKKVDEDEALEWGDDHMAGVEDPFAVSSEEESSDDSFDDKKRKPKTRRVDTTLASVSFQTSDSRIIDDEKAAQDDKSDDGSEASSGMSSLSNPADRLRVMSSQSLQFSKSDQKRQSKIQSWLLRNRDSTTGT